MSSLARRIELHLQKEKRGNRSNTTRNVSQTGYEVCHFTKGWRRISAKRLAAQHIMARLRGA